MIYGYARVSTDAEDVIINAGQTEAPIKGRRKKPSDTSDQPEPTTMIFLVFAGRMHRQMAPRLKLL